MCYSILITFNTNITYILHRSSPQGQPRHHPGTLWQLARRVGQALSRGFKKRWQLDMEPQN